MSKIRIGQIGVSHAHATKLAVYRMSPRYEVVGIVEPDEALRRKAETLPAFQSLPWMTEEQLLNTPNLEAVLVETAIDDLLPAGLRCLQAGKHIHLDKPAGTSLSEFRKLVNVAASKHLIIQLGYMYRYNPGVVIIRDILKRGWLGEPFEFNAVMSKVVPPADRLGLARYEGGTMFELGCHLIDLMVGFLGKPNETIPYSQPVRSDLDQLQDNMLAVCKYDKALATIRSTAVEVEGFARRHLTICGTEGTAHLQPLDSPKLRIAFSDARGQFKKGYQDVELSRYVRYVDDAEEMALAIRGERDFPYSYQHDLDTQETILRASGMPIT